MKYAEIENSVVVNTVLSDDTLGIEFVIIDQQGVGIGWGYDGSRFTAPIVQAPIIKYQTVFDSLTFRNFLSEDEFYDIGHSAHTLLKRITWLFQNRNGEVDANSNRFKQVIAVILSEGIIDQARHDELLLGIPLPDQI